MSNLDKIKAAGVVGAGGAGFPTHVKLAAQAEVVIANGAECEPLLRVDQQVMERYAAEVVRGMQIAVALTGAVRGVICLKEKYKQAVSNLQSALNGVANITLQLIDNYYPAGDEQALVYEVTGRVVPVGGIPIHAGAVVLNVSTLVGITNAVDKSTPVTHKYVTITGAVERPTTVQVPIGTPIRRLIAHAKGPAESGDYAVILGGPAMGAVTTDWDTPVTKILGGIIVLPTTHSLIGKKTAPLENQIRLSRSVCCQCNQCTMLCPRNTLGLGTSPHKAMRALAYGKGDGLPPEEIVSCCECGICTYFACNMELMPHRIMGKLKGEFLRNKVPFEKRESRGASDERPYKNLPTARMITRLGLKKYDVPAPMEDGILPIERVKIPLKQHIGAPCTACVTVGQAVTAGDAIGTVAEGQLGSPVHTGISGVVTAVTDTHIEIQAKGGTS
ncbi:MAG: SLBB domain-containing protein [Oscillospiraceae bacterium]|nr:SLBB domain-containing protein [Oscillospiraceae bacterium]